MTLETTISRNYTMKLNRTFYKPIYCYPQGRYKDPEKAQNPSLVTYLNLSLSDSL